MARHGVAALLLAALVVWAHARLAVQGPPARPCGGEWVADEQGGLHCGVGALAGLLVRCPPSRPVVAGDRVTPRETPAGCHTEVNALPAHQRLALGLPLDLNEASPHDLEALSGVGPALAGRIVAARPFSSVADLERVRGIGSVRRRTLAPRLRVGQPRPLWPSSPPPAASTPRKP